MKLRHYVALRQLSSIRRELEGQAATQELEWFLWSVTKHVRGLRNWTHLSAEERVARVQAHREAGLLTPPDVAFYAVAALATSVAILRLEHTYEQDFAARFDVIDRRNGLDVDGGETWLEGEEPDEHRALAREFDVAADRIVIDTFREFDEPMADLLARDGFAFHARLDAGRTHVREWNAKASRSLSSR